MRTAFIVWNPFQLIHFQNLINKTPDHRVIIFDKGKNLRLDYWRLLEGQNIKHEFIHQKKLPLIDGAFDCVLFQSPFPHIEKFAKSKLVSLQYGLAKERHNYGEWRALADLNLMYGPYSVDRVAHFSSSIAVGNPKFDHWDNVKTTTLQNTTLNQELGLDRSKKTILYMPTWGELGSFSDLAYPLSRLQEKYNVIVKMHHNNEVEVPNWRKMARRAKLKKVVSGDIDSVHLLARADLVISDFSGAIFDALYARIPVLLYHGDVEKKAGLQKFDLSSLEYARRNEIGLVCENVHMLDQCIAEALAEHTHIVQSAERLRQELFVDESDGLQSSDRIVNALRALCANTYPVLSPAQKYVRETVQTMRIQQRKYNKWRSLQKKYPPLKLTNIIADRL